MEEKKEDEAGDDDDEWEDASEEEEAGDRSDLEKKDKGKAVSPPSAKQRLQEKTAGSPKEQRAPRPKVIIPPPPAAAAAQGSPEGGKPLSPFFTLEGHHPVSDWGEEMEMQSPRSSMGAESPMKPSSTESSPPQKKESQDGGAGQPGGAPTDESAPAADAQENVTETEPQQTASEPPSEGSDLGPSSAAPEVNEVAVTTDQNPLPAPSEGKTSNSHNST